MALVTDEAVVLTVSDYSETSQIVTLFSRRNGKVRTLAKGAKRPKSPFGGPIDKLQRVEAVFSARPQSRLGTLAELTQAETFPGLRDRLPAFRAASCAAELVLLGTEELDPSPELFDSLTKTLRALSTGQNSAILLYYFELQLLRLLGLMPELGRCVSCRRRRSERQGALFSPAAGGVLCRRCRSQGEEGIPAKAKALEALSFLASASSEQLRKVHLAESTAKEMRRLLRAYWAYHLGREPRAMRWAP